MGKWGTLADGRGRGEGGMPRTLAGWPLGDVRAVGGLGQDGAGDPGSGGGLLPASRGAEAGIPAGGKKRSVSFLFLVLCRCVYKSLCVRGHARAYAGVDLKQARRKGWRVRGTDGGKP